MLQSTPEDSEISSILKTPRVVCKEGHRTSQPGMRRIRGQSNSRVLRRSKACIFLKVKLSTKAGKLPANPPVYLRFFDSKRPTTFNVKLGRQLATRFRRADSNAPPQLSGIPRYCRAYITVFFAKRYGGSVASFKLGFGLTLLQSNLMACQG